MDDGTRCMAVLEVDVDPLKANKGRSLRGEDPRNAGEPGRSVDFWRVADAFFAFVVHLIFCVILSYLVFFN